VARERDHPSPPAARERFYLKALDMVSAQAEIA
jgi:hypothetical protein